MFAGSAPDRITDFTNGTDKLTLGFVPAVVLTGSAADFNAAATAAQSLFDGRAGWFYAFQRLCAEVLLAIELLDRRLSARTF